MHNGDLEIGSFTVPYIYGVDCAEALSEAVASLDPTSVIIVLDTAVRGHAEPLIARLRRRTPVHPFLVSPSEERKRLSLVESLMEHAVALGADRKSVVVAMGGGLVGNVAGLTAALLFRGVRLVHLPTTPVAAFDAVLSLKQGVNLSAGKNLSGTYLAPTLIGCDLAWLTSIPRHAQLTGIAEMAKNVLAVVPEWEERFVGALARLSARPTDALLELFALGLAAKAPLLKADPYERNRALIFEYGHTVGHALEFLSAGEMGHGEAIAWGMLAAAAVSVRLGHLDEADLARHHRLLSRLELPSPQVSLKHVDRRELSAKLTADNKRGQIATPAGHIPMVLLRRLGEPVSQPDGRPLVPVSVTTVLEAVEALAELQVV